MNRVIFCFLIILTQCGWGFPNGWDLGPIAPTSIVYPVYQKADQTTNQTLTAGQSGQIIIFTGASNNTRFFLPTATLGLDYTFINDTTKYIAPTPQSTDTIQIASTVAGHSIQDSSSTAIGDSIELVCDTPNSWSIKNKAGTWATGN